MKYLSILFFGLFLFGCAKTNGDPQFVDSQGDPPPLFGLSVYVGPNTYSFRHDQVTFYSDEYHNLDPTSFEFRPNAHTITFIASDSVRAFSMTLNLVDLQQGDYFLDGRNGTYNFQFIYNYTLENVQEHYQGSCYYMDDSGTSTVAPEVSFRKLGNVNAEGSFMGLMTNMVTHEKRYVTGDFYYKL